MTKKDKRLWIDMCAGSELKDTQGETLSVDGADITELEQGRGRYNDNHGKGSFNSLGMITEAKKIFKAEDCENERHKYYWDKIKAAFIYTKGYLHNNEDHPNARATAAIMRNIHNHDSPLKLKASVEGGVVARGIKDPTRLARTKIASVALTFTPANNATLCEPLNLDKSSQNWEADKQLIKSVMHLAETNIPSFRHIERHASANTIHDNIQKIKELAKTIGVDIEIKESNPDSIMTQAVVHKVHSNINKISEMVKTYQDKSGNWKLGDIPADKPIAVSPQAKPIKTKLDNERVANKENKQLKIDRELNTMKDRQNDPIVTSSNIGSNTNKPTTGIQQKSNIVVGRHAKKAAADPAHLENIFNQLKESHGEAKAKMAVGKIKEHMNKSIKDSLIKALTAGYGGAGAPGGLTGGGVIQSESLDDGRTIKNDITDGISYISCDNCGNEQVYMKHQVRCRSCNKSFSLEKLKTHM